jgi:hypothetical protein
VIEYDSKKYMGVIKIMPRKRLSRAQEKAIFAKKGNRVYPRYHEIETPSEQRELKKEIVIKVGGVTGAAVGLDLAGVPGGIIGKKSGEYLAEKAYDEIGSKETNKSKEIGKIIEQEGKVCIKRNNTDLKF